MKKFRVEYLLAGLALLFLVFTVGFFLGRGSRSVSVSASATIETSLSGQPETTAPQQLGVETTGAAAAAQININTATQAELEQLPGIGAVLAERIISYRSENGDFQTPEELQNVSGIGEKKYEDLEKLITVR